ncbi:MAG: redoxin domain-containing protein [Coriobacteriia bacterium]|nr:redoxin domain-containing protein [Coriobacteriia bacterium]MBN2822347.1 redoxin domain-containing protein [Coriobacteriia bacterium]
MAEKLPIPEVGSPAPGIKASTTGGGEFDLAAHRGEWVVVYFYPRANTPG